jgi:hypothetical protein
MRKKSGTFTATLTFWDHTSMSNPEKSGNGKCVLFKVSIIFSNRYLMLDTLELWYQVFELMQGIFYSYWIKKIYKLVVNVSLQSYEYYDVKRFTLLCCFFLFFRLLFSLIPLKPTAGRQVGSRFFCSCCIPACSLPQDFVRLYREKEWQFPYVQLWHSVARCSTFYWKLLKDLILGICHNGKSSSLHPDTANFIVRNMAVIYYIC